MEIRLNNLKPASFPWKESEVWDREQSFRPGEKILLKAPSGKGKTTFLSFIYGTRRDYSGEIIIDGQKLASSTPLWWASIRTNRMAVVFQDLRLFPAFSGWDNIRIKALLTESVTPEEITAMAGTLDMEKKLEKTCETMSWGEKQRIALLRALTQPFKWLLLDEPFSHLDKNNRERAARLIRETCEKQGAGLLVTSLDGDDLLPYDRRLEL